MPTTLRRTSAPPASELRDLGFSAVAWAGLVGALRGTHPLTFKSPPVFFLFGKGGSIGMDEKGRRGALARAAFFLPWQHIALVLFPGRGEGDREIAMVVVMTRSNARSCHTAVTKGGVNIWTKRGQLCALSGGK